MKQEEIILRVAENLASMRRLMAKSYSSRDIPKHLPTRSQMGVMFMIEEEGTQTIEELAAQFQISSSAATQLVNGLAEQGFLARSEDKDDCGKMNISFTNKAKIIMTQAKEAHVTSFAKLLEPLTLLELERLEHILDKIIKPLK